MEFKFDLNLIYWDLYPQHKVIFSNIYNSDDEYTTSKLMWAIAMLLHPDSDYWGLPTSEKQAQISKAWLDNPNFKWEPHTANIILFKSLCLTPNQRALNVWKEKMEERNQLLDTVPYTLDTLELLDKALVNSIKITDGYNKAVQALNTEKESGTNKGNIEESFFEKKIK